MKVSLVNTMQSDVYSSLGFLECVALTSNRCQKRYMIILKQCTDSLSSTQF